MNKLLLLLFFLFFIFLTGCPENTIWTGGTYTGTITKSSNNGFFTYYNTYHLYCSGRWEFSITSKNNVEIYLEGDEPITMDVKINPVYAKAGTNSVIVNVSGFTDIYICVKSSSIDWQNNGYIADYSFTATLK
jgi:hypothetical protein